MKIHSSIRNNQGWIYFGIVILYITIWSMLTFSAIPPDLPNGLASVPPVLLILFAVGAPSTIGILLTGLLRGWSGIRSLLGRLIQWRIRISWYAVCIFLPALLAALALQVQHWAGGPLAAPQLEMIPAAIGSGIFSGIVEELGWRGLALPAFQKRYSAFTSALLVGVAWGIWHTPLDFIRFRSYGAYALSMVIVLGPVLLTGYSILMTWVYNHTSGSLLTIFLFHLSITASSLIWALNAPSASNDFRSAVLSAGLIWAAALIVVALAGSKHLVREPQRQPAAAD